VAIYIPKYVVGHWWENLLHNQSALRLKHRLRFEAGVMVTNVPWRLRSTTAREIDRLAHTAGDVRRGRTAHAIPQPADTCRRPLGTTRST
jgi:hypothetical protein